jgi:hypothetical protein
MIKHLFCWEKWLHNYVSWSYWIRIGSQFSWIKFCFPRNGCSKLQILQSEIFKMTNSVLNWLWGKMNTVIYEQFFFKHSDIQIRFLSQLKDWVNLIMLYPNVKTIFQSSLKKTVFFFILRNQYDQITPKISICTKLDKNFKQQISIEILEK